jgi:hypothetical protein
MVSGRLPTVPEYYAEHINKDVDLVVSPKQCCPFHSENTPSFSYNIATGRWSCFGKCHAHGGVVKMHKMWYHFSTEEEAERDLMIRYNVPRDSYKKTLKKPNDDADVSQETIEDNIVYTRAVALANCPERWIELDYEMSKTPFDRNAVEALTNKWTGKTSLLY